MNIKCKLGVLCFLFVAGTAQLYSQNISVGDDCEKRNCAILTQAIINLKGHKWAYKMARTHHEIWIAVEIDSLGYIIRRVSGGISTFSSRNKITRRRTYRLIDQIETYLIQNKIRVYDCHYNLSDKNNSEYAETLRQNYNNGIFEKEPLIPINHLIAHLSFYDDLLRCLDQYERWVPSSYLQYQYVLRALEESLNRPLP